MNKFVIYQVFPRWFGNDKIDGVPNGSLKENGCGKLNDFTMKALRAIRDLGVTHVWFTGVIEHATQTDYTSHGIALDHASIVKGKAGSPYAIKDYYDIDPDLAVDVNNRMQEFEALVARTHEAGLKVILDFVPNHVAREYHSDAKPNGIQDFGETDRSGLAFHPDNNFYYIPDHVFAPRIDMRGKNGQPYYENPARATGNDCFSPFPERTDWYETVKLNYGVDYLHNHVKHFDPQPNTWHKMWQILRFWASKGVDGFRCDMAEMVPVEFWQWVTTELKKEFPKVIFVGEVYQPDLYRSYIQQGGFDYLYDKVGLYDTLRNVTMCKEAARQITSCWQQTEGIHEHMLYFLENHDEQRLASTFFAGTPEAGRPAMAIAALMHANPVMIYAGQELGEAGMQSEGYSGCDGRTSIYDYIQIETMQQWRHQGTFDGALLPAETLLLRDFYQKLLHIGLQEKAIQNGAFYDLMYASMDGFDTQKQYAFMRYAEEELILVVANFSRASVQIPIQIPQHAFDFLSIETELPVTFTDLLTGQTSRETLSPDFPFYVTIEPQGAIVYKCNTHHTPIDVSLKREAGTVIPIFSLRSTKDEGIGDFLDLKPLVDWAVLTHQTVIQTLPVNDTTCTHTWKDSYPYNSISVFALHPLYLNVKAVSSQFECDLTAEESLWLSSSAYSTQLLDYDAVDAFKWKQIRLLYRQMRRRTFSEPAYSLFFQRNRTWLEPYAAFSFLREKYHTSDFRQWPAYSVYVGADVSDLIRENYEEVAIYYFVQYHLDAQLREAHDYAREKGIRFKGDIPIGISRNGVDAWTHHDLFNFEEQAGAPPDDFSDDGQNWGFPTYNWERMAHDGYAWWKMRLEKMAEYFDAYRLDHILGFFRIFEIPMTSSSGLLGHFRPALPLSWTEIQQALGPIDKKRWILPYLDEDLLQDVFGSDVPQIVSSFLKKASDSNTYLFKPAYRTQCDVAQKFASAQQGFLKQNGALCEKVQRLFCEVLFIPDEKGKGYHPRINAYKSYSFKRLPVLLQQRFMKLYNDFYYVRHTAFWKQEAMKKLPALVAATPMIACGEDLGMIPDGVQEVMQALQIMSLEIERMPKMPHLEFGILKNNPYLSVCTTSSHDTSTIRGWWEEDRACTERYFHQILNCGGEAPYFCEPWICERILSRHLLSPSRWVIFPLQDWLSIDGKVRWEETQNERINVPSEPNHYWRYRMHINLESLLQQTVLNEKIARLVQLRDLDETEHA